MAATKKPLCLIGGLVFLLWGTAGFSQEVLSSVYPSHIFKGTDDAYAAGGLWLHPGGSAYNGSANDHIVVIAPVTRQRSSGVASVTAVVSVVDLHPLDGIFCVMVNPFAFGDGWKESKAIGTYGTGEFDLELTIDEPLSGEPLQIYCVIPKGYNCGDG